MKATGIVRRIDDLGRVVVPKEIRRTLRIREGDPMEIFTNHDGEIILKKYSPIGEIEMFAKQYADVMAQVSGQRVLISDRDQIIAVAGGVKKDKIGMAVSSQLEELMSNRDVKNGDEQQKLFEIIKGEEPEQCGQIIYPIICEGDVIGSVIVLAKDENNKVSVTEQKLAGVQLSPMMQKILTAMKQNSMTVTMITGKNVNEVTLVCDVRLLPGFGQKYLEEVLKNLAEKWDCSYRIVSLSQGYESSPDGEMLKILEEATLEILGKTKEEAEILPFVSMGSSDGRFLADLDTKVYGYSPVYAWDMTFDSAVTMVHGINERIHRDSVVFGSKVLTLAVCRAAQSGI